jgi:NAD(P)-dependent dehydrogenase (short-subunit alcohol dehydrogenase family)
MTDVAGKTLYITGGASGMVLLAGKMLAGLGAHIVILDLNPTDAALHEIESARRSLEQRVARYKINIADREMVIGIVGTAIAGVGAPDVLINRAGIGGSSELVDMKFETYRSGAAFHARTWQRQDRSGWFDGRNHPCLWVHSLTGCTESHQIGCGTQLLMASSRKLCARTE